MIAIDWSMLWDMGGHGPYVWSVYLGAMALIAGEALALGLRQRRARACGQGSEAARKGEP